MQRPAPSATEAVATTAVTNGVLALVSLFTGVLAARLLGPEARGHLAAAQTIGSLVGVLGTLAMGESIVYFVGRRVRSPRTILHTAVMSAVTSVAVCIVIFGLLMPTILRGAPDAVNPARAYSLIGFTFVLLGMPITYLRALQRYQAWNSLRVLPPAAWLIALVTCLVLNLRDVTTLVVVFVGVQAAITPVVWRVVHHLDLGGPRSMDRRLVRPMLRYGAPLLLATLPQALNYRLDQLLIANLETAEQLGLYAVSVSWASLGLPVITAVGGVLFPHLASSDPGEAAGAFARAARATALLAMLLASVSALTAPLAIPLLFGQEFRVSPLLSLVMGLAAGFFGLNMVLEEGLRGVGRPRAVLLAELAGIAVTVGALLALIRATGILGAGVASLLGYGAVWLVLVHGVTTGKAPILHASALLPRRADALFILTRLRSIAPVRTRA